jgi:hypothetical protein
MPVYFFDSSATVKRYAVETGSKWVFPHYGRGNGRGAGQKT